MVAEDVRNLDSDAARGAAKETAPAAEAGDPTPAADATDTQAPQSEDATQAVASDEDTDATLSKDVEGSAEVAESEMPAADISTAEVAQPEKETPTKHDAGDAAGDATGAEAAVEQAVSSATHQTAPESGARGAGTEAVAQAKMGGGTDVAANPARSDVAAVADDTDAAEATRVEALKEQQGRGGTSMTLEAHRETLRQQTSAAGVAAAAGEKVQPGQTKPAQTSLSRTDLQPAMSSAVRAVGEEAPVRLRDMPMTAAQAMAPTPASRTPPTGSADAKMANTTLTNAAQTSASPQALATGTVLQSSSAVVTSVFGASDSPRTGEDVLTQRGAESFALPQLIAEASVRSGASSFRAETPRHVAQQLAEAVATGGKRNVDVSLNPRELGHVNMRVTTTDVGVTVTINAERPETEDLMRRHIQDLAREFKEMGFSDISFQFGSDAQAGQSGDEDDTSHSGASGAEGDGDAINDGQHDLALSQQLNIAADGLDMRI